MGEAKRRQREISELKKTLLERKRVKRTLGKAKTEAVYHFRSEAARRAAGDLSAFAPLRNAEQVTRHVKLGNIALELVQEIPIKILTPVEIEPSRQPRTPQPFPIAVGCQEAELAHYVAAMAQISPGGNGFRKFSAKAKNWQSTTLSEQLAIRWLDAEPNEFKRSERGQKKLERRNESNAVIILDQLIERWLDRALQARHDAKMLNWFIGKIASAYPDLNADWLRAMAEDRINHPRYLKFVHAAARRRLQECDLELEAA